MLKMVKYICLYWFNSEIPQWRIDCFEQAKKIYPEATIISYINTSSIASRGEYIFKSNAWRLNQVSLYDHCLWLDNDIWLDGPLDLPDGPGMADEYNCNHWSIIWSGNDPGYFIGKTIPQLAVDRNIKRIKINGIHWGSDLAGNKCKRM